MSKYGSGVIFGAFASQKKLKINYFYKMKNFDDSPKIQRDDVIHLLEKVEDMNQMHAKINTEMKEISDLICHIDSINNDLNDFQYLFKLINKEHIFIRHFEKSFTVLDTFRKWLKLNKIANQDLSSSSEKILLAIRDSKELIEIKLKLENNLHDLK